MQTTGFFIVLRNGCIIRFPDATRIVERRNLVSVYQDDVLVAEYFKRDLAAVCMAEFCTISD